LGYFVHKEDCPYMLFKVTS